MAAQPHRGRDEVARYWYLVDFANTQGSLKSQNGASAARRQSQLSSKTHFQAA
ncbi:hypothetical protein [Kingella sp. (in: b-proteobacteria)]|uniref:hypothetical protein n=1 Tax=Kingella sp. (in: b-proteobacteria) TaxID=2020713 RepID=UPI0026DB77C6|nr:hypothetical protein [Kingella sp. (in: b-proteobacteria)]MDO4656387.1 hypothetical protein [Kingella sp. (in: b-proteobacteria)]